MKRPQLTFTFLLIFSLAGVQAQDRPCLQLQFGLNAGLPVKDPFRSVLGAEVKAEQKVAGDLAVTLSAGFNHFFEKDHFDGYTQYSSPFNVIPLKAGAKYYLGPKIYASGEAGVGLGFEQWKNSFLWSPSLGITFSNGIDLSVKYEDYARYAVTKDVALRLAYTFHRSGSRAKAAPVPAGLNGWEMSIGFLPGMSMTGNDPVFGSEATVLKPLSEVLQLTFSAGYSNYSETYTNNYMGPQAFPGPGTTRTVSGVVPVKAGLRYYPVPRLHIGGAAGAGLAPGGASFVYTPAIGLDLGDRFGLGLNYSNYSSIQIPDVLGFELAYRFKL